MNATDALRERGRAFLTTRQDAVLDLSHALDADPELAYEEHRAARRIGDLVERAGFEVTRGAAATSRPPARSAAGSRTWTRPCAAAPRTWATSPTWCPPSTR